MATKPMSNKEKQRLRAERAAAALKEKQRRERRRQILTVDRCGRSAIALVVGGGFLINSMRDDTKEAASKIPPPGSGSTASRSGRPTRRTRWSSTRTSCARICGEFEAAAHEQLAQLADQGKVQVEYRPFVLLDGLGPYSSPRHEVWSLVLETVRTGRGQEVPRPAVRQPARARQGPFPSQADLVALAGAGRARDAAELQAGDRAPGAGVDWPVTRPRAPRAWASTAPHGHARRRAVHQTAATAADFGTEPDQGGSVTP